MPESVVAIRLGDDGLPEFNISQVPGLIFEAEDGFYIAEVDGVEEVEDGILYTIPLNATVYLDPDAEGRVVKVIGTDTRVGVATIGSTSIKEVQTATRAEPTIGAVAKVEAR